MEQYFEIGKITGTHGIRGTMRVFPTTEDPFRFERLKEIIVEIRGKRETFHIQKVATEEGEELGEITEIFPTGSNDVYVVKKDGKGKELLLPAIKDCIKNVDLENGVMTVKLLEGLR